VSGEVRDPNLARLAAAAKKLEPLLGQIVFVGGCVTGLLITDAAAAPVRPTLDVDAIVEVASYAEYIAFADRLRQLGFHESPTEGAPICRWVQQDFLLDLLPTDSSVLGFSNRWYRPALQNAQVFRIDDFDIRLITAPYFLATKLEAFHGRGKSDYRMSRDIEDLVTVMDGRAEIISEVLQADHELRRFLAEEFSGLLANRDFLEALPGHLLPDVASQRRLDILLGRVQQIAGSETS
jgi:hypothetical protein